MINLLKLIPIRDWIYSSLITLLVSYHVFAVIRASEEGYTNAQKECEAEKQKAFDAANRDWVEVDNMLIRLAELNKQDLEQQLSDMQSRVDKKQKVYKDHATANPLPADCKLDPERVRLANKLLNE